MKIHIEEHVEKAKKKDEEALKKIFNAMEKKIKGVCAGKKVAGYSREDLYQISKIIIYDSIIAYDPKREASLSTYAKTAMENKIRKLQMKNYAIEESFDDFFYEEQEGELLNLNLGYFPERLWVENMDNANTMIKIKEIVASFKEIDQKIFYAFYENKRTMAEVARSLGITENHCIVKKKRILERIRKILSKSAAHRRGNVQ